MSILLACIADSLGPRGRCGDWTAKHIRNRLTNPDLPPEKRRKLRLQDGDEDEYRLGLKGKPGGPGAVAQAWRIARRLVAQNDVAGLLTGIERFRVVSIALGATDDPQQIFESLNATGRPLTESEKVKNWLLMGLPDEEQQDLHDNYWIEIEQCLGVELTTEPVDTFLRDVLRLRTGKNLGIKRVHEELRRLAVRQGQDRDRPALCRELARLARLYGILTGTAGKHPDAKVERELRHLRAMGIHTHRPLTLRLLDDAAKCSHGDATDDALSKTLAAIGTWITRLWLANRATAGLNTAATEFAHGPGPDPGKDFAKHWLARFRRLRNTRVGVPGDEEVREGIRNRKAYGGTATRSSFAFLCALMEAEHREEAPARKDLTIEHVMPRKLTDEWKRNLGEDAEDVHGLYRDLLPNLTLSGDATNSGMGAGAFAAKRKVYAKSTIGMTRRLAAESEWNEEALGRRADDLADRALERWPWADQATSVSRAEFRWRIEGGAWRPETVASRMVLNVVGALLDRDPVNAEKLSGDSVTGNVHPASQYPPGKKVGALVLRAVPGHDEYVLYPYGDFPTLEKFCRGLGKRCGVRVEVLRDDTDQSRAFTQSQAFWRFFKERAGGVPGQKNAWRFATQRTTPVNPFGDTIRIYIGKELLRLDITAGKGPKSGARAARMRDCSRMIRDQMNDQELSDDPKRSEEGLTASVQRSWTRDDESEWAEAARWIRDQHDRLRVIASRP